jgi:O-methyltransferase involved in polyketide biosynthesis
LQARQPLEASFQPGKREQAPALHTGVTLTQRWGLPASIDAREILFDNAAAMVPRQSIQLGEAQESLLVPLYARALDSQKKRPILNDPKAIEMVQSIDWDFQRFNQGRRVLGCVLRTAMFDEWVKDFLSRHPQGTVVEIGAGLNTRFERLDNGTVHWFDLDLPDTVELRRKFFHDSERRVTLAASVVDKEWMATVSESPAPYCFVAEAVFIYLTEPEVKAALAQIAANFPHAVIAFDAATRRVADRQNRDMARRKLAARFQWSCEDPRAIERWNIGWRLVESRSLDVPDSVRRRLSWSARAAFRVLPILFPQLAKAYRLNLFVGQAEAG